MCARVENRGTVLDITRSAPMVVVHTLMLLVDHFLDSSLGQVIDRAHVLFRVGCLRDNCDGLVVPVLCTDRVTAFDLDV